MAVKKEKLILFDAYAIIHRAYHALPDFRSQKGEPTGALYGLSNMLIKTIKEYNPKYMAACFDLPKPTFRDELYEDYKAGREKTEDELISQLEKASKIFEVFGIPIYDKEGFEADDMLGTIVEQVKDEKNLEVIIASGDMDTLSLVYGKKVKVYTLRKGITDTVLYDEDAVKNRFGFGPEYMSDYKALRGDPSDNIPGVPGIGEKTATQLITNFGGIENIYDLLKKNEVKLKEAGIKERVINLLKENKEGAAFSKSLATIRKDAPIQFDLPNTEWREKTKVEKITEIFKDLSFRSLQTRLGDIFDETPKDNVNDEEDEYDDMLYKKTALALWVLDSNNTSPSLGDILHFTKKKTLKSANEYLMEELEKQKLINIYRDIELPLIDILGRAEERGILIDKKALEKISKEYHKDLKILENKIWKLAGEEFNINSPKQLSDILFNKLKIKCTGVRKTKTGNYSTDAGQLQKIKGEHEVVQLLLEYREIQKLLSTYIDNLPEMLDKESRLHTTFVQTGTTTGRLSSKDPNLQNIPIRTKLGQRIREAFVASEGFALAAYDYSQIDLRSVALLSKDERLLRIFKEGGDVHKAVASEVFGVSGDDVTKDMRRRAKIINFGIVYGMGVNALRQNLGTTKKEAQEFYDKYFETFSGVANYMEEVKAETRKKGYTETYFGRRRYFPDINSSVEYIAKMAERMAVNAPVQGTSADIIKIASIRINEWIKTNKYEEKIYLLLQVHDELIFEIDKTIAKPPVLDKIESIMENVMKEAPIPFPVHSSSGPSWADL